MEVDQEKVNKAAEVLLERGNEMYKNAEGRQSPAHMIRRLQSALFLYRQAVDQTTTDSIRSVGCKSIGLAHWLMAKASLSGRERAAIFFNFREALKYFQKAQKFGHEKEKEWHQTLAVGSIQCWSDVLITLEALGMTDPDHSQRVSLLDSLVPCLLDDMIKAQQSLELAGHFLRRADSEADKGHFEGGLGLLEKAQLLVKRAQQWGGSSTSLVDVCVSMEERVVNQRCRVLSMQCTAQAEVLLGEDDDDDDDVGGEVRKRDVWGALDLLQQAVSHTEGKDLVQEAIALTRLARVYHQMLGLKSQARSCLVKAVELTVVLFPLTFTGQEWYKYAQRTLEHYQEEQRRVEEEAEGKERSASLPLIKDDLDLLKVKEAGLGDAEFLHFLYSSYPPRHQHTAPQEGSTDLKAMYRQAVLDYVPEISDTHSQQQADPNDPQADPHWAALSSHIHSILTRLYTKHKGC